SRESQDHMLHLDRALASFFDYLAARFGPDKLLITLTADHGFLNVPEYASSRGFPGMRIDSKKLVAELNEQLAARFGEGIYALGMSYPTIILDRNLIAKKSLEAAQVETAAARIVAGYPGIAMVYTRT